MLVVVLMALLLPKKRKKRKDRRATTAPRHPTITQLPGDVNWLVNARFQGPPQPHGAQRVRSYHNLGFSGGNATDSGGRSRRINRAGGLWGGGSVLGSRPLADFVPRTLFLNVTVNMPMLDPAVFGLVRIAVHAPTHCILLAPALGAFHCSPRADA
jgi:hypothetical protein